MCMRVKCESKTNRKGFWAYKVVRGRLEDCKAGTLNNLVSPYRGYAWKPGWHIASTGQFWYERPGAIRERLRQERKVDPFVEATVDISGGVFHCFTSLRHALRSLSGYQHTRVVMRVWVPENSVLVRGTWIGARNVGVKVCFLPRKGAIYDALKCRWV